VTFLRETAAPALGGEAGPRLIQAAEAYQRGIDRLQEPEFAQRPCFLYCGHIGQWTDEVRQREQQALTVAMEMDEAAVKFLEQAVAAMGS